MNTQRFLSGLVATMGVAFFLATTVAAAPIVLFTTGAPDGRIATASRPANSGLGQIETETADDFVLGQDALVTGATFTGLLPAGASLSSIQNVEIELYHIFPVDSANPPSGRVPTRVNSPSDTEFAAFNQALGDITVTASIVSSSFLAANSVINGINPIPNQTTGGEGAVSGEEVLFTITFKTPFLVGATDHDFFRPEVGLSSGSFLWLSAAGPNVSSDLQAWIRNANLDPDWLRIGTDIVGGVSPPQVQHVFFSNRHPRT